MNQLFLPHQPHKAFKYHSDHINDIKYERSCSGVVPTALSLIRLRLPPNTRRNVRIHLRLFTWIAFRSGYLIHSTMANHLSGCNEGKY